VTEESQEEIVEEAEVEPTLEELVLQYEAAKVQRSALEARCDQLKEKIIEVYDRDTPHEGVVLPAGDNYNVSVVDQGRTMILSKSDFERKYGTEWVKNHTKQTYHRRLSIKKKK